MNIPLEAFENWLKTKNLKKLTITRYRGIFKKFILYPAFNQETINEFLAKPENQHEPPRTFLRHFQRFITLSYRSFNISEEQYKEITEAEVPGISGRKKQRLVRPLTYDQILLLEKHLESEQLKLQLLTTFFAGLRLGEMMKITILSFNWDLWKRDPTAYGECNVFGKGDKEGIALIPPFMMSRIGKFIKTKKFTSLNDHIFDQSERQWQRKLTAAGRDSGITLLTEAGRPIKETIVHPHRLRHSYANYLLKVKKLDIRYIQELMRHSSISSTQIYTQVDKEELKGLLRDEVEKIEKIEEMPSKEELKEEETENLNSEENKIIFFP